MNAFVFGLALLCLPQTLRAEERAAPQGLIDVIARGDKYAKRRAIAELTERYSESRAAISEGLKNRSPSVRRALVSIIAHADDRSFYPEMLPLAKDPDQGVRATVLGLAFNLKTSTGIQILRIGLEDTELQNRMLAVRGLGEAGGETEIATLKSLVETSSDSALAAAAAESLAGRGDKSVRKRALELANASSEPVRVAAIKALGYAGSEADKVLLRQLSDSKDIMTRREAALALKELTFQLQDSSAQREKLESSLKSENLGERRWAVTELMRRADKGSRALLQAVASDPNHPGQREAGDGLRVIERYGIRTP